MSTTSSSAEPIQVPQENPPAVSHEPDAVVPDEQAQCPIKDEADDGPSSYFSLENLKVAQVNIIGGSINGYAIGFVAVYSELYKTSTNCGMFKSQKGCDNLINAECAWSPATLTEVEAYCGWSVGTCSKLHSGGDDITRGACLADTRCTWSYSDTSCGNRIGYTSSNNGIFAGSMVMGCLIGSYFAGDLAVKMGNRLAFLIVGLFTLVCSIMIHVSADSNEFWVLCVGRFILGLMMGLLNVACPVYVDRHAHEKYKKMIGVLFQVFTGFGIMFASLMGLALGFGMNLEKDPNMLGRMEGFVVFNTMFGILLLYLSAAVGGEDDTLRAAAETNEALAEQLEADKNINEYSWCQMSGPLIGAFLLAGTMQLTGINAVMNFAPAIMVNLGMEPLSGNAIVMSWNFVCTLASIPFSLYFTQRRIFLTCSITASLACMFLCGIPVYPNVTKTEKAKNGVAIFGMAVFLAAFESGIGPSFYVLSQELFPRSFRPKGSSFTMVMQFIFNLIINVCYPIATERISGGPSGNQDKGQAIAFIFFGGIGFLCFVGQIFFIFPWEDKTEVQNDVDAISACEDGEDDGNQAPQVDDMVRSA